MGVPVTVPVAAGAASVNFAFPSGTHAGDYAVQVTYAGSADLHDAGPAAARPTVRPAAQTVSFAQLAAVIYGTAPLTLAAAGGGSGLPVAFTVLFDPARFAGPGMAVTGAVVVARQAGTGDYLPAADVQQRLTVRPAPLTLTAADAAGTAGLLLPALSFRVTGLVNGDAAAVVTRAAATTVATAASPAGSYPVLVTAARPRTTRLLESPAP